MSNGATSSSSDDEGDDFSSGGEEDEVESGTSMMEIKSLCLNNGNDCFEKCGA
jgi:hypothetical protein